MATVIQPGPDGWRGRRHTCASSRHQCTDQPVRPTQQAAAAAPDKLTHHVGPNRTIVACLRKQKKQARIYGIYATQKWCNRQRCSWKARPCSCLLKDAIL